MTESWSEHVAV